MSVLLNTKRPDRNIKIASVGTVVNLIICYINYFQYLGTQIHRLQSIHLNGFIQLVVKSKSSPELL